MVSCIMTLLLHKFRIQSSESKASKAQITNNYSRPNPWDFEKILKKLKKIFWKKLEKIGKIGKNMKKLGKIGKIFENILKRFWKYFENILKRFWKDFENILKRYFKKNLKFFEKILKKLEDMLDESKNESWSEIFLGGI